MMLKRLKPLIICLSDVPIVVSCGSGFLGLDATGGVAFLQVVVRGKEEGSQAST
jgi:hypothetical protein